MLASGQLLGHASGPPRKGASPATVTSSHSTDTPLAATTPCWESAHSHSKLFGEKSPQEEIGRGVANYLGPKSRLQEIL